MKEIKRKTINFNGEKTYINIGIYPESKRIHVWANTENGKEYQITEDREESILYGGSSLVINKECRETGLQRVLVEEGILGELVGLNGKDGEILEILFYDPRVLRKYDPEKFDSLFVIINEEEEEL